MDITKWILNDSEEGSDYSDSSTSSSSSSSKDSSSSATISSTSSDSSSSATSSPSTSDPDEPPPKKKEKRDYEFGSRRMLADFDFSKPWTPKKRNKFKGLMGMSRETFLALFDDVKDYLPIGRSTNGRNLLQIERLMYFLKSFAKNELSVSASYSNDVSTGALSENTAIVIEALNPKSGPNFCKKHIYLPSAEKGQWEAMQFHEKYGFPPLVYGCADGTHVDVSKTSSFAFDHTLLHHMFLPIVYSSSR